MKKPVIWIIAGVMSSTLAMAPAAAHPRLIASTPLAGAAVKSPAILVLKFSEKLVAAFSGLSITPLPAHGTGTTAGKALLTSVGADGRTLVARLTAPLPAGAYTLAWHAVSVDTHRVSGSYCFTAR